MQEPMTDFLRRHGFRHDRDIDRGQIWTNGLEKVAILKSYKDNPAGEKNVIDTIRKAARVKEIRDAAEKAKFEASAERAKARGEAKQLASFADVVIKAWPEATPEKVAQLELPGYARAIAPEPRHEMTPEQIRVHQETIGRAMKDDTELLIAMEKKLVKQVECKKPKKELPPPTGKLPRVVMKILLDEDTTASQKVKMILAWANEDEEEVED